MIIPWMSTLLAFFSGISAQALSSSLRHLRGVPAKTISGTMCGEVRATSPDLPKLPFRADWDQASSRASPQAARDGTTSNRLFFKTSSSSTCSASVFQFIFTVTVRFQPRYLQLKSKLIAFLSILEPQLGHQTESRACLLVVVVALALTLISSPRPFLQGRAPSAFLCLMRSAGSWWKRVGTATPLRGLSWALSSPCSRASWTGCARPVLSSQTGG